MPRGQGEFELVVARLDSSSDSLEACLSADERSRAARFFFARDRRRYIAARARLRELLGERLGVAPKAVELVYGENGKPHLAGGELHFNVAHCNDVALFGFSRFDIGVDLEALRPIAGDDAIAAQWFSPAERLLYELLEKPLGFLYCWTRKEALAKATGEGLAAPARKVAPSWRLHSFFPLPGFIAAVACHCA
jgi:4'-phosphopantetheinyl transferase